MNMFIHQGCLGSRYRKVGVVVFSLCILLANTGCSEVDSNSAVGKADAIKTGRFQWSSEDFGLRSVFVYEPGKTPLKAYRNWVFSEKSGLTQNVSAGPFGYSATYKPHSYILAQDKAKDIKTQESDYGDLHYFELKLDIDDWRQEYLKFDFPGDLDYESKVKYFAFQIQDDLVIESQDKQYRCVMAHWERTYDLAPYMIIQLAFEPGWNPEEGFTLVYNDRITGKGEVNFQFSGNAFQQQVENPDPI